MFKFGTCTFFDYTDSKSRHRSIMIKHDNIMAKPGMNNKFMSCRKLKNPAADMNKSPHVRPNVSTNVANKPELNVPDARAVGITLLRVDPITPSNA